LIHFFKRLYVLLHFSNPKYIKDIMETYWEDFVKKLLASPKNKSSPSHDEIVVYENENKSFDGISEVSIIEKPKKMRIRRRRRSKMQQKSKVNDVLSATSDDIEAITKETDDTFECNAITSMVDVSQKILKPQQFLESKWSFWYSVGNKSVSWEKNQIMISTVSTFEQFSYVFNQLKNPSKIMPGHTFSVFKHGILPDWEDKENANGGRWMIASQKNQKSSNFDSLWYDLLVMIVIGNKEDFMIVNGLEACSRNKGDRLEVWVKEISDMKSVVNVGRKVKDRLGLDTDSRMKFSIHKEDKGGVKGPRLTM